MPYGAWKAEECALIFLDGPERDPRLDALLHVASQLRVPIIRSTVGDGLGSSSFPISPDILAIDRSTHATWEETAIMKAVSLTGKRRLVLCSLTQGHEHLLQEAFQEEDFEVCLVTHENVEVVAEILDYWW